MLAMNVEIVPRVSLIGFVAYTSPWIHFERNTDEHVLYIIKSGELHMRENGVDYVLRRGDMLLLEPGIDHEGTKKAVCDYYYFHFKHPDMPFQRIDHTPELARRLIAGEADLPEEEDRICYVPKYSNISDKNSFHQILHAMNELVLLYQRKPFHRGLTGLRFSELLIELSRVHLLRSLQTDKGIGSKTVVKVHALLDYIHRNYTGKITSAQIERELESNYDYLNRIFKTHTGQTIVKYINKLRIRHAQELIQATNLSFGEIGYLTGLDDPYYFSKVFKQYVGMSPSEYYKNVRG